VAVQNELQNQYKTHQRPLQPCLARAHTGAAMGFNKRKMEDARRQEAEKEAAARRATDKQILEDAEQLVTAWKERQAERMPMLLSPTIGAAIKAGRMRRLRNWCAASVAEEYCAERSAE
jgi:beta-phosphoglucomutase-like phosphatase (HAD superfamily)